MHRPELAYVISHLCLLSFSSTYSHPIYLSTTEGLRSSFFFVVSFLAFVSVSLQNLLLPPGTVETCVIYNFASELQRGEKWQSGRTDGQKEGRTEEWTISPYLSPARTIMHNHTNQPTNLQYLHLGFPPPLSLFFKKRLTGC